MKDPDYYCVLAVFIGTNLTKSINVLHSDKKNINEVYQSAEKYFQENSSCPIEKLILYNTESDMHLNQNVQGVYLIETNTKKNILGPVTIMESKAQLIISHKQMVGKNLLTTMRSIDLATHSIHLIQELQKDVYESELKKLIEIKKSIKKILNKDFDELAIKKNTT